MYLANHLDAGHDRNGNPLRGWHIFSAGDPLYQAFVTEGHEGRAALEKWAADHDAYIASSTAVFDEWETLSPNPREGGQTIILLLGTYELTKQELKLIVSSVEELGHV